MKKLTAILVMVALVVCMLTFTTSAADLPEDITADIKWITSYDMYEQKLPIVRADAVMINAMDYDATLVATAPGSGIRSVTFSDWDSSGMEFYFDDYYNLGDGDFFYEAVWANSGSEPYDHGLLKYTFEVEEAGTYELVIVGCAEIKAENVDNDSKDRGFAYSIDGGEIKQVNISDTLGAFRGYNYVYGKAELEADKQVTANGVNSGYYQPTYYYGMQMELTAGTHTLEYYHLFYSGDHVFESGNGPRLNFCGAFVQKYLSEAEFDSYEYPEITTIETTTATPIETTTPEPEPPKDTEPVEETPGETDPVEDTPTTTTPAPKDTEPAKTGGCGSVMGLGVLVALIPAAIVIKKKRD